MLQQLVSGPEVTPADVPAPLTSAHMRAGTPTNERRRLVTASRVEAQCAEPNVPALDLLTRANDGFVQRLALVRPDQWPVPHSAATRGTSRALVNHVVGANRRYTMLLHGATADDVDATRTADHLGDDPVASFVATHAPS